MCVCVCVCVFNMYACLCKYSNCKNLVGGGLDKRKRTETIFVERPSKIIFLGGGAKEVW